ncbi:MAG TPA: hypothetical protein VF267_13795 [Gammaproteobacteria bacterium]
MKLQAIYRVTVFVPRDRLRQLVEGIKRVYALGDNYYDSVLWYLEDAHEEFRARPGANPARGEIGALHQEPVSMLVFSLPRDKEILDKVLDEGIKANHPWEAPGLFVEESWTLQQAVEKSPPA